MGERDRAGRRGEGAGAPVRCGDRAGRRASWGPVVFSCDAAYAMPLATALRSLAEANRDAWPLDVRVLSEGFAPALRDRVARSAPPGSVRVRFAPVDLSAFRTLTTQRHISRVTFARLLIPGLFPPGTPRALYLDADLLVLGDLGPLWEVDLGGAVLGAALDALDAQIKRDKPGLESLPRVARYFNSGMLLIDLDRWREARITERALRYLVENPRSLFSEQDALNVVCDGEYKLLDPHWNFQSHYDIDFRRVPPAERPAVVHFVKRSKPWRPVGRSLNAAFYDEFRRRTRFPRSPLERVQALLYRVRRRLKRHPS